MEKVTGIGGLFFRSNDPAGLANWYLEHLGIDLVPQGFDDTPWTQTAGPTVFAPFDADTDYFGNRNQMWMVNFRVNHLELMIAQLRESGIEVALDPEDCPNGRFARIHDPEGNPIELWEPFNK